MKKSIGGINNNLVACILILLTIISGVLGLFSSFAALILETDDKLVRFYAKNMIVASLISLIISGLFFPFSVISIVYIIKVPLYIILIISMTKAYNLEIWDIPVINDIVRRLNF